MQRANPSTRLICALTSSDVESMRLDMASAAAAGADAVECRLDFLEQAPSARQLRALLSDPPLEVIVTCRPKREGGKFAGEESERLELLRGAARHRPAFVDVEMDVPREDWPDAPVILSHHDFDRLPQDLDEVAAAMEASDAAVKKVAFAAGGPEDALRALEVLRESKKPTIALAMGEAGLASRILAGKFGAMGTYAALREGAASAPAQPTIERFKRLYRWDGIGPGTKVYAVIGCPVAHSMSPAIHNAAFEAAGLDAVYVPLRIEPGGENFSRFMDAAMARPWLDLKGLSVTIPHKENALAYVGSDNCDELAVKIGAVNTVTISPDGGLRGDDTDYAAAIDALVNAMDIPRQGLSGRAVAVLGAGGAARAIVAALRHYGADVTIYNRTVSRGERLAEEFGCRAAARSQLGELDAEIVINCTPIGMHPNVEASPLERIPSAVKVVFDTIYNPIETVLLARARTAGCLCISGLDMFVNQAVAQFETWTGRSAPRRVMRQVAVDRLSGGQ